MNKWSNKLKI